MGYVIAFVLGGLLGIVVMCLMFAAGKDNDAGI